MRNVTGSVTTLDAAFLDGMRQIPDPPADAVARGMCDRGDHHAFLELVKAHELWSAEGNLSLKLPEDVRQYLNESGRLPAWHDPKLIAAAEQFFLLHGLSASTILACASLPECYVMKYGTDVLSFTRALRSDPGRRIQETARMIMDVMCPGGLSAPGGRGPGVRTTQKVRLMHAVIRHMYTELPAGQAGSGLPAGAAGAPINQEDLAFTMMTFSYVMIRGFERLGARMSPEERDAYVHCWAVVGALMGIRSELLPASFGDAEELFGAIQARQRGESKAGRALTAALLGLLHDLLPHGLKRVPVLLTRDLVGNDTADLLGVPATRLGERFLIAVFIQLWSHGVRAFGRFDSNQFYRLASERLHRTLMDRLGRLPGSKPFEIPVEFVLRWLPGEAGATRAQVPPAGGEGHPDQRAH